MTIAANRVATVSGVEALTEALLPLMQDCVESLGLDISGAENFYGTRLESGRVFLDYEIQLVEAIRDSGLASFDGVHEIGCGWGQLVFLLAWQGHRSAGFEMDPRRASMARRFHSRLFKLDSGNAARAAILHQTFPQRPWLNPKADLVIATNLVSTHAEVNFRYIVRGMRRYRYAIIDVDRFGRMRGPHERGELVSRIEEHRLKSLGLLRDAPGGHFYLFETQSPV